MGESIVDRSNYNASHVAWHRKGHVNMHQLRLYIDPPTVTQAMRERAKKEEEQQQQQVEKTKQDSWQCRFCTLTNGRYALKCSACRMGKRPSGIVKRRRAR